MSSDSAAVPKESTASKVDPKELTSKDYYFDSYSHFGIHEEMLKDTVRTRSYMRSIMENKDLFKDKIVLDVGCGTGILSMFAAKAGAKKVYGVECAGIYKQARAIVKANGFEDTVEIIHGKLEEIELPVPKVDIIISEWMGYFLLYESMLDSVIDARDRWLAKDGALFPDTATIYLTAIEDAEYREDKMDFWNNVYGFDMSCIRELSMMEPLVDTCNPQQVMANSCGILDIDLYTCTKEELDFKSNFKITATRDDYVHALVGYFTCTFSKCHKKLAFSTGPKAQYTHWKQTVFYLEEPMLLCQGESVTGSIDVKRNDKNPRDLDIHLSAQAKGTRGEYKSDQKFRLR